MKNVLFSAVTCLILAGTSFANTGEIKIGDNVKLAVNSKNEAPIRCTGTLTAWQGGVAVDVKVKLNNDITSDADCEKWVQGQADEWQKALGSGYQVKNSYSFVK